MFEIESIFLLLFTLLLVLLFTLYELGVVFILKVFGIIIFGQLILHLILYLLYSKPKDVRGKRVLITGAASGIGRLLALKFAQLGAHVILWDIRKKALADTGTDHLIF